MNGINDEDKVYEHKYQIIYSYKGGLGRMFLALDCELNTRRAILSTEGYIAEKTEHENVFITSFIKLESLED